MHGHFDIEELPDELYRRLKELAAEHRRSLNQEAIAQLLESTAQHGERDVEVQLRRLREFTDELRVKGVWLEPEDIDRFIEEGRP